jgi:hypothetical protein
MLAAPPPDRRRALVTATKDLQAAERCLADREAIASRRADQLAAAGPLAGLTRRSREQRRLLQDKLASDAGRAAAAKDSCNELARRTSHLRREQDVLHRFEAAEGWRRTTSHASGPGLTTTGPKSSPPVCKRTTLSPTGSTSSATLAPPRPRPGPTTGKGHGHTRRELDGGRGCTSRRFLVQQRPVHTGLGSSYQAPMALTLRRVRTSGGTHHRRGAPSMEDHNGRGAVGRRTSFGSQCFESRWNFVWEKTFGTGNGTEAKP